MLGSIDIIRSSNLMLLTCDLKVLWYLKPGAEAEVETRDNKVMEGSSKPDPGPPGQGRTSAMSGPRLSYPLEKLHNQTDSFLTAARLIRRGRTEEGKNTEGQCSNFNCSVRQPPLSKSDRNQGPKHAEISLKEPRSWQVYVVNSRKMAEDRETSSKIKAGEAKQTYEGAFLANRQRERLTGLYSQAGIVCVRVSSCRTAYRQSRRFKAPILPVIAEI